MQLKEVQSASDAQLFIKINALINGHDPNYIQPLNKDIEQVFDPAKNKTFKHGEVRRWILSDKTGKPIGRIAAFVNNKYVNKNDKGPVGGVGFFDCIHNQEAADMLLDVARSWLLQKGMVAMDGPINFGERDRWWGMVVSGFDPPLYCMNYNPPYYQELWENYGFKNFFNQICFALDVKDKLQSKFYQRHAEGSKIPGLRAEHIKKNQLDRFAKDFATVYNKAWAGHGGLKQLEEKVVRKMFNSMKPVLDERVCWFAYHNDEPIAIWINLPDLNQWFKELKGKFGLLDKLKFLWLKKTKPCNKFVGLVFGVVPEWQGKGVDSFMIVEACKVIQNLTISGDRYEVGKVIYDKFEMQWIGEFNPKMINVAESLGTYRSRVLTTYRYNFDRTIPFEPHPIL